jgi:hypothetical protein
VSQFELISRRRTAMWERLQSMIHVAIYLHEAVKL